MVTTWYEPTILVYGPQNNTEPTILLYGPQNNTRLAQAHYDNMHQLFGDSPTSGRLSLVGSNHYGNIYQIPNVAQGHRGNMHLVGSNHYGNIYQTLVYLKWCLKYLVLIYDNWHLALWQLCIIHLQVCTKQVYYLVCAPA